MSYDQETVIGVLKQCQDMMAENPSVWDDLDYLISMAKRGEFIPPTLEEVWKEKCKEADSKMFRSIVFEFKGKFYSSNRYWGNGEWIWPITVEKL